MAIKNFLRKLLRKESQKPPLEYVQDEPCVSQTATLKSHPSSEVPANIENEIDFLRQSDLENYARDIHVSKESIERWISSGLLMPEELKVAEKLVKFMRNH